MSTTKKVGPRLLPKSVPKNLSKSVMADMHTIDFVDMDEDDECDNNDGDGKVKKEDAPLMVAKKHAKMYGV